jgi:hypothetical protein
MEPKPGALPLLKLGALLLDWVSSLVRSMNAWRFFDAFEALGAAGFDVKIGLGAAGVVQVTFWGRLMGVAPGGYPDGYPDRWSL